MWCLYWRWSIYASILVGIFSSLKCDLGHLQGNCPYNTIFSVCKAYEQKKIEYQHSPDKSWFWKVGTVGGAALLMNKKIQLKYDKSINDTGNIIEKLIELRFNCKPHQSILTRKPPPTLIILWLFLPQHQGWEFSPLSVEVCGHGNLQFVDFVKA